MSKKNKRKNKPRHNRNEFQKITGFENVEKFAEYEQGYNDCQELMINYLKNWNGVSDNSAFSKALLDKFNEIKIKETQ